MATIDLTTTNSTTTISGVKFTATESIVSGTGGYFTFLAVADNDGTEEGFNHDSDALLNTDAAKTQSLRVGQLEVYNDGGTPYYVFRLDMNEPGNATGSDAPISLNEFKLYTSATVATSGNYVANDGSGDPGLNFTKIFDLDAGGDNTLLMKDLSSGGGGDDYLVLVAKSVVDAAPNTYLSLYWQFSNAQGGFEEARALTVPFVAAPAINVEKSVSSITDGADWGGSGQADSAGDTINYSITIQNTGNVGLTGVTVTDAVESYGATNATYASGDAGTIGTLDVGETWTYTANYVLTQADLNNNGGGDGDIDNLATGDTGQTDPDSDDAVVELVRNVSMNIDKSFVSVANDTSDFGGTNQADSAGDIINYGITIQNTGNVSLTGVTVTDAVEAYGATNATYVSGDAGAIGTLDVGETWNYTATYTVTQADLNNSGGGDNDIDNLATGDTDQTGPDTDSVTVPLIRMPSINVTKVVSSVTDGPDFGGSNQADSAGDTINYAITIQNTGNIALTGVTMTDAVEAYGATNATYVSGDAGVIGTLEVGETWNYTATYVLTAADLSGNGGGDGDIDNVATGDTAQTAPDTAEAAVTLVRTPAINVTKVVSSITDGADWGGSNQADSAGDTLNYAITIQNIGNVALTGVTMTDTVQAYAPTNATYVSGDAGVVGTLDIGETWNYTASYVLTQADLDNKGGGDSDIDNVATGDTAQTAPDTADAFVPLVIRSTIDIEKYVQIDGGAWQDADTAPGPTALITSDINFKFVVTNTGNVSLTNVSVSDNKFDLDPGAGANWSIGNLAVGGVATFILGDDETVTFQVGQHTNVGTVTGSFGATPVTDNDAANYWGVVGEGLSHGYWKTHPEDWDAPITLGQSFESYFGIDLASWSTGGSGKKASTSLDVTFEQALALTGGGAYALAREAVAAVLNYYDEDISYGYDLATIKSMVKTAYDTSIYDPTKNLLENENTSGDWF